VISVNEIINANYAIMSIVFGSICNQGDVYYTFRLNLEIYRKPIALMFSQITCIN